MAKYILSNPIPLDDPEGEAFKDPSPTPPNYCAYAFNFGATLLFAGENS